MGLRSAQLRDGGSVSRLRRRRCEVAGAPAVFPPLPRQPWTRVAVAAAAVEAGVYGPVVTQPLPLGSQVAGREPGAQSGRTESGGRTPWAARPWAPAGCGALRVGPEACAGTWARPQARAALAEGGRGVGRRVFCLKSVL
jgi:hypothetical protein